MDSTIEQNTCRLCAKRGYNYHPIFNTAKSLIAEKIHNCLPIVVHQNDKLPSHICKDCLKALNISNKLRSRCLLVDSVLRQKLEIEKMDREEDPLYIEPTTEGYNTNFDEANTFDEYIRENQVTNPCNDNSSVSDDLIKGNVFEDPIVVKVEEISICDDISAVHQEESQSYCDICKITIKDKELMDLHIKFHEPSSTLCLHCVSDLPSPYELYVHTKSAHGIWTNLQMKWSCETCKQITDSPGVIRKHTRRCPTLMVPCKYCDEKFASKNESILHARKNHYDSMIKDPRVDKFRCKFCNNMYLYENVYQDHLQWHREVMANNKTITSSQEVQTSYWGGNKCTYCHKIMSTKRSLETHLRVVHCAEKEITAETEIQKETKESEVLKNNTKGLENRPKGARKIREKTNKTEGIEKEPQDYEFTDSQVQKVRKVPIIKKEQHKCKYCGVTMRSNRSLKKHIHEIHTLQKEFKCDICPKISPSATGFMRHQLKHKNRTCELCKEEFNDVESLDQHTIKVHNMLGSNRRKFFCHQCCKGFKSQRLFRDHNNFQHTGDYSYTCEICKQTFKTSNALWTHQQKHKSPGFYCHYCNKRFHMKFNLRLHLAVHQDPEEWSYYCDVCKKKFKTNGSLAKHMKVSPDIHLLPCDLCGVKSLGPQKLKKHMRQVHNI